MTARTPTNRAAKDKANASFRQTAGLPEELRPNEAPPLATSTPGTAHAGALGGAVADPTPPTSPIPTPAPTPPRVATPPPATAAAAAGGAPDPPPAKAGATGPPAPAGHGGARPKVHAPPPPGDGHRAALPPTDGPRVNRKEKDRYAIFIRTHKGVLTRYLGKAKDLLLIVQANPPPTVALYQNLIGCKENIAETLAKLDEYYCDIALADQANAQSYLDKCEEQHLRAAKHLRDLTDASMAIEYALRQAGFTPSGTAIPKGPARAEVAASASHVAPPVGTPVHFRPGPPSGPSSDGDGSPAPSSHGGGRRPPAGGPPGPPGPPSSNHGGSQVSHVSSNLPVADDEEAMLPSKVNQTLKPSTLTRDATPVEFRTFMRKFSAYYKTSNMHRVPLDVQREYFANCIEAALYEKIEQGFTPTTPILPKADESVVDPAAAALAPPDDDPSAFQLLYNAFMRHFPLVTRRFNLFKNKPSQGQAFTDWTKKLHKQADECDIHLMTEDDIFVMLYLSGVQNQRLSEELHKLQNPTPASMYAAAEAWEIAQAQKKIIGSDTAGGRAHSAQTTQHRRQQGNGPKPAPPQRPNSFQRVANPPKQQQPKPSSSNFQCFRCGNKNKEHTCNAKDAICKFCGKKGHFKGVCNARAKAEQTGGASKTKVRQTTVTGNANGATVQQAGTQ